jgi:hypothetical protein
MAANQTYAIKKVSVWGDLRVVMGTYTNASGSTGGAIVTGLNEIFYFNSSCETSQSATVNLVSISGGTATMTVVDNEDGHWIAIGV